MSSSRKRAGRQDNKLVFEDGFPTMVRNLGTEGFMDELSKGFGMLMDRNKGVITFESLKRNAVLMGLGEMGDDELKEMVREGDTDGDGCLNEKEFFVLMFRLSPELLDGSNKYLEHIIMNNM
ncbi:hypothetical protein Droror1_Dr00014198 [Drosera rotundifolia]